MDERPRAQHAAHAGLFLLLHEAFTRASRRRLPEAGDVAVVALASYKLSRIVAREEVADFLRAPVTEDPDAQRPKQHGFARALGELLTCPFCLGLWSAAGFTYALVRSPRESRFAMSVLGAHAVTGFLNAGFVRLRG